MTGQSQSETPPRRQPDPDDARHEELTGLLRALVQEARQHTILLAQLIDEVGALRQSQAPAGAEQPAIAGHDAHPPHGPQHPSHPRSAAGPGPSAPGGAPFDVLDLAAVLPEQGGSVRLHARPEPDAPAVTSVRAGSIVQVIEERDPWVLVSTRDGVQGWALLATLGEV
jgi:hypothetical protein